MLERLNTVIEKHMAFVTPACLILGVAFPEIAGKGVPLVPVMFAVMTFIGALKSSFRDIAEVFRRPFPLLLSMLIRSFAVPVFIGLAGGVVGMLAASKGIGLAFPYALMQVGMNSNKSEDMLAGSYGGFLLASALWLLLFLVIADLLLRKRDVRS